MNLKATIIQFSPELGDLRGNISRLDRRFDEVGGPGLVVLPELASSGYAFRDAAEAFLSSEELSDSEYVDFLVRKSKEKDVFIVSGINERAGDRLFNSSILVGPDGILARYRKLHLFMNEKDIFQPGDGDLPVVDLGGCTVGMMICFDYLFPEPWRAMAVKGADVICHPSNLLTLNAHRCLPGLAIMNRIFILTANRTGVERGTLFNGRSLITDPAGEVLATASPEEEETITVTLDILKARNKWITPRNHVFGDRRPALYTNL